jgi:type IV pilus assembly protein PilC
LLLRLPVIGEVIRFALVERFCRTLSSMVSAGVGLPTALGVVANGANNIVYERALTDVRNKMMAGEGFARPIADTGLFPATVMQMVKAGEETGTLDLQLRTAASFYAQELGYRIKRLTTLFEPAIIVFMGLVVGFVAIALVEAMYGIFKQTGSM